MKTQRFIQGYFKPRHPEKYIGNVNNIIFRSSWELKFNNFLDSNPNILYWGSEIIAIPYVSPIDSRVHKYYVDYLIVYKDKNGVIHKELIEIKPKKQTKTTKRAKINEQLTFAVNTAKWESAKKWCEQNGIVFRILTEEELFR